MSFAQKLMELEDIISRNNPGSEIPNILLDTDARKCQPEHTKIKSGWFGRVMSV